MKYILAVLAFASAATAADLSPSPAIGTVLGGDIITIHAALACGACPLPKSATVTFGDARGKNVTIVDRNTLTVMTPPHARGSVPLVVTTSDGFTFNGAFTFSGWGGPLARDSYEAILLPIPVAPDTPIAGANGSRWTSELWVANSGTRPVEYFASPDCVLLCPTCCMGDQPLPNLAAGASQRSAPAEARLMYMQRGGDDLLTFALRVRDVSRTTENAGTDIPVVRESAFRTTPIELVNVPIDSRSRTALRVYDTDARSDSTATLRIYSMTGTDAVAATQLTLPKPAVTTPQGFVQVPGYGYIPDLKAAFPQLADGRYRVEVTPAGFRGWAFAASTNNDTQLVTTVTPQ
jgi:IPT/TIG domain